MKAMGIILITLAGNMDLVDTTWYTLVIHFFDNKRIPTQLKINI